MIIRQVAEQAACFYFLLAKSAVCATICITLKNNGRLTEMVIEIDFNSDEAIYVQLMNQIIMGIATSRLQEGDPLPSVRQLADTVGINMHTVNKAYSLLRQEGFVTIDRRRGAIIAVDVDKIKALEEMKENLLVALAKGCCRNVSRSEVHDLIDEIYDFADAREERRLIAIAKDGTIDENERPEFDRIVSKLADIIQAALAVTYNNTGG